MRLLPSVPSEVGQLLLDEMYWSDRVGPSFRTESIFQGAVKLASDTRMIDCWAELTKRADPNFQDEYGGWATSFVLTGSRLHSEALRDRRRWMHMALPVQAKWERDFVVAMRRLEELIDLGPLPTGLADRVMYEANYSALHRNASAELEENEVEAAASLPLGDDFEIPWDPFPEFNYFSPHVLNALAREQLAAARDFRQTLKKPNDSGAWRVRFIKEMSEWCCNASGQKLQQVVATSGAVLFEDDAITIRLVQTHTRQPR